MLHLILQRSSFNGQHGGMVPIAFLVSLWALFLLGLGNLSPSRAVIRTLLFSKIVCHDF